MGAMAWLYILIVAALCGVEGLKKSSSRSPQGGAVELTSANLTSNLEAWSADLAVMFYAPWCKYCKQLKPSWDSIAKLTAEQYRQLAVTTFNCEEPPSNAALCSELGIDRYPSIYYFGYASFNQAPRGNPFGAPELKGRVARFNADLYPEAIYEWIKMLSTASSWQRRYSDFVGLFSGRSHMSSRLEVLARENAGLQEKVDLYGVELEKLKADNLFDSLLDSGDPFPSLSKIDVAPDNLALRTCISEMTREYCKYHSKDAKDFNYCSIISECSKLKMEPQECRPKTCPLDQRGCRVASACLQDDVIDAYQKAIDNKKTTTTTTTTTAATAAAAESAASKKKTTLF